MNPPWLGLVAESWWAESWGGAGSDGCPRSFATIVPGMARTVAGAWLHRADVVRSGERQRIRAVGIVLPAIFLPILGGDRSRRATLRVIARFLAEKWEAEKCEFVPS